MHITAHSLVKTIRYLLIKDIRTGRLLQNIQITEYI